MKKSEMIQALIEIEEEKRGECVNNFPPHTITMDYIEYLKEQKRLNKEI